MRFKRLIVAVAAAGAAFGIASAVQASQSYYAHGADVFSTGSGNVDTILSTNLPPGGHRANDPGQTLALNGNVSLRQAGPSRSSARLSTEGRTSATDGA